MELVNLMKHAAFIRKELFKLTTYIPRNESPNPYWGRTEEGLVLIQYYGCPGKLGTPLGGWAIDGGGSDSKNNWLEESYYLFGMKEIQPMFYNEMGEFGPIHAVTIGKDGVQLPEPKEKIVYRGIGFCPANWTTNEEYIKYTTLWKDIEPQIGEWKVDDRH